MRLTDVVNAFSSQPWRSLMLALLLLLIGYLFLRGWLPPAGKYFPGHEWFMAVACAGLVLFLVICAVIGFRKRGNRHPP